MRVFWFNTEGSALHAEVCSWVCVHMGYTNVLLGAIHLTYSAG